jgi:hypothetical protein
MTHPKYTKVRMPAGLVRELAKELGSREAAEEFIARKAMHGLMKRRRGEEG